jgi:hypothetical protein
MVHGKSTGVKLPFQLYYQFLKLMSTEQWQTQMMRHLPRELDSEPQGPLPPDLVTHTLAPDKSQTLMTAHHHYRSAQGPGKAEAWEVCIIVLILEMTWMQWCCAQRRHSLHVSVHMCIHICTCLTLNATASQTNPTINGLATVFLLSH